MERAESPVGLVLAGGMSRRFGGGNKALAELDGAPLVAHVVARIASSVCRVAIACGPHEALLKFAGCPLLDDGAFAGLGPLAGIHAGLQSLGAGEDWLVSVPCDMPFVEGARIRVRMEARQGTRPVTGLSGDGRHDGIVLWHRSHRAEIAAALSGGADHSIRGILSLLNAVAAPAHAPSLNVNTQDDLERARRSKP